jgi:hypothetical protein
MLVAARMHHVVGTRWGKVVTSMWVAFTRQEKRHKDFLKAGWIETRSWDVEAMAPTSQHFNARLEAKVNVIGWELAPSI